MKFAFFNSLLILSLASGINVFTLTKYTEFLIDSLGYGDSLILFPHEKRYEEMVCYLLEFCSSDLFFLPGPLLNPLTHLA